MALKQGFYTFFGDPFVYQERSGGLPISAAFGINSAGSGGTGTWELTVIPSTGANPNLGTQSLIVDAVTGTITWNPTIGYFNIGDGSGTGRLTVDTIGSYQLVCGGTGAGPHPNLLQTVSGVGVAGQVLVSNGAGALPSWGTAGSENITYTAVNHAASPYTALSTDYYLGCDVTAGIITIRLPNAPATGRVYIVKDKVGLAATSNITVTTVGGAVNLDGATTFVMNTAYETAQFVFNGTSWEVF